MTTLASVGSAAIYPARTVASHSPEARRFLLENDTNVRNMHDINREFKNYLAKVQKDCEKPPSRDQQHHH